MKKPTTPAIKSQLEVMSGKVATVAPQSAVARLVHGEIKGGEAKHNFIMSVIRDAILQAYKGNTRDIPEAMKLATGKSVKARAFHAGFHTIADMVERVAYVGKYDSADNAAIRTMVEERTDSAAIAFERAYLDVFAVAKAESADKREAKKAESAAAIAASAASAGEATDDAPALAIAPTFELDIAPTVEATDDAPAPAIAPTFELDIAPTVDAIVDAIRGGLLSAEEMTMLRAALAVADEATEATETTEATEATEAAPLAMAA